MIFDLSSVFVLLGAVTPVVVFFVCVYQDRRRRKEIEKPPQSEKLLHPPGHSLALRLDDTFDKLMLELGKAFLLGTFSSAAAVCDYKAISLYAPFWFSVVLTSFLVLCLAACVLSVRRSMAIFHVMQNIRLGLRGEQAVAEALSEAAEAGFRSFHDVQTDKVGNLDHIAVGVRGVFLIETKARRKRGGGNGLAAHEVGYDGEVLQFPHGRDAESIKQARCNAAWLSDFLRNETGDPVEVFPLVVLPGWFVKKSERGNSRVEVMAAKFLPGFLARQSEKIDPAHARRIINALDKKCRTVEF